VACDISMRQGRRRGRERVTILFLTFAQESCTIRTIAPLLIFRPHTLILGKKRKKKKVHLSSSNLTTMFETSRSSVTVAETKALRTCHLPEGFSLACHGEGGILLRTFQRPSAHALLQNGHTQRIPGRTKEGGLRRTQSLSAPSLLLIFVSK